MVRHAPSLETVVSPDGSLQIACAGGDSATGRDKQMPSTRLDKGPLTGLAVEANRQMSFPRSVSPAFGNPAELDLHTWILLFYLDEAANDERGEIRSELSLPDHFTGKRRGFIDSFKHRIRLASIIPDDAEDSESRDDSEQDEIEIPVSRRST